MSAPGPLYHVRIRLPADEGARVAGYPDTVVADTLFSRIHRAARGYEFALGLPDMQEGECPSIGCAVEVFSASRLALDVILDDKHVRRLLRDHCVVSPVRELDPAQIVGWERYVRDRRIDRAVPSRLRRAQRRREAGRRRQPVCVERGNWTRPWFRHLSLTTARNGAENPYARVFVRREPAPKGVGFEGGFNSFGFSAGGAVPVLRGPSP